LKEKNKMNKSSLKTLLIITLMFIFSSSINAECTKEEVLKLVYAGYNKTEISALCEKQDGSNEVSIKSAGEEPEEPKNPIKEVSINSDDKGPKIIARDGEYVKYENGIVYDKKNGLEWVAGPDKYMGGQAAKKWVKNLNLDGGGWRMPSADELKKLCDRRSSLDEIYSPTVLSSWFVWSSVLGGVWLADGTRTNYPITSIHQPRLPGSVPRAFAVREAQSGKR
jgi:hypothetical protein